MFLSLAASLLLFQPSTPSATQWYQSSLDNQTYEFRQDDPLSLSLRSASGEIVATLSRKKTTDKFKGTTARLAPQCPNGKGKIEVVEYTPARIKMRVEKPQESLNGKAGCMMLAFVQWENFELVPGTAPAPAATAAPPSPSTATPGTAPPSQPPSPPTSSPAPPAPSTSQVSGRWRANLARTPETKPLAYCISSVEERRDCVEILLAASSQQREDIVTHWIYPAWRGSGWTNPSNLSIRPATSPECGKFLGVWPRTNAYSQGWLEYEKCWGDYHLDFSERGHLSDVYGRATPFAFDMERLKGTQPKQFPRAQKEIADAQKLLELVAKGAPVEQVRQGLIEYGDLRTDPAAYRQMVLFGSMDLFGSSDAGTLERCYLMDANYGQFKVVNDELTYGELTLLFRCIFTRGERRFSFFSYLEKNQRSIGHLGANYAVAPRSRHPY